MQPGKILVADCDGVFALKLVGDVRLTFCTALDSFVERMFGASDFAGVVIDLAEADNIDSTTLGQLAKIAITSRQRFQRVPVVVSTNPSISRVLDSMGFGQVFDIRRQPLAVDQQLGELPAVQESESGVRERVINAHRVLMGMNEHNRAQFQELVSALEASR
jgi:anti-anti-sigma factor